MKIIIMIEILTMKQKDRKKLGCDFIWINPDKEDFAVHEKPSTKYSDTSNNRLKKI